jgi:starch-binding outer membrane protein, SusD/RagB family
MKFKRNLRYIVAISVAIVALSCTKDLDLTPRGEISDATFWMTASDFELAANAFYQQLDGPGYDDNWSDIAFGWQSNSISNGSYVVPENSTVWNKSYQQIRAANKIIAQAEQSELGTAIDQYKGEAMFFRAFYYYKLYRLYGGVPLINNVLNTSNEELYSPRATREETVDFILDDLSEAASGLGEKGSVTTGRVTKGAALALKARVALFEGTWRKFHNEGNTNEMLDIAIAASNEVISSGKYALFTGKGDQSYRYLFIEEGDDSDESIFDRRYHREVAVTDFGWWIAYETSSPTKKMADMYLCSDGLPIEKSELFEGYSTFVSEFENRDPRMTQTFIKPGLATVRPHYATNPVENWPNRNPNVGYMLYKFISEDVTGNTVWGQHQFDWRIIRYAEVLLTYAEAVFEKNGSISDADLDKSINLLRARVDMPPLTNTFVTANGLDMREEIRRERTVELAFEMYRYDDLRRWKVAETELPKPVRGIKITDSEWATLPGWAVGTHPVDDEGFVIAERAANRTFEVPKHYWQPLPSKQISLYPDILSQNPGWQ